MQSLIMALFFLSLVSLLPGCSVNKKTTIISTLPKINNQFTPFIVWKCCIGEASNKRYYSQLAPVYDENVVYAANREGIVKAIDAESGKILWSTNLLKHLSFFSTNLSTLLSSGLTVSGDKIYIGAEVGKVVAIKKINGELVWEVDLSGEVLSQPVISDGLVLVHSSNGILEALDLETGKNKWSINLGTPGLSVRGKSAPAISDGLAIVGSSFGCISAIILSRGDILWQQYISDIRGSTEIDRLHDINMTPVIDTKSGVIFAIAYNGNLAAIDIKSRTIIWERDFGSVNNITVSNDVIYLVDQMDRILAIYKIDGHTLWSQDALSYRNLTSPVIYDGYLTVGDGKGYIHWVDLQNGKFMAQNRVSSSGVGSLVIADDKLLLQAKDGSLYLITR